MIGLIEINIIGFTQLLDGKSYDYINYLLIHFVNCVYRWLESATVVDHKVSLTDAYNKRLDLDNLQSLCTICHNRKSRSEQLEYLSKIKNELITQRMEELEDFGNNGTDDQ